MNIENFKINLSNALDKFNATELKEKLYIGNGSLVSNTDIHTGLKIASSKNRKAFIFRISDEVLESVLVDVLKLNIELFTKWYEMEFKPDYIDVIYEGIHNVGTICYPDQKVKRTNKLVFTFINKKTAEKFNSDKENEFGFFLDGVSIQENADIDDFEEVTETFTCDLDF